jgi:hypothetical protein
VGKRPRRLTWDTRACFGDGNGPCRSSTLAGVIAEAARSVDLVMAGHLSNWLLSEPRNSRRENLLVFGVTSDPIGLRNAGEIYRPDLHQRRPRCCGFPSLLQVSGFAARKTRLAISRAVTSFLPNNTLQRHSTARSLDGEYVKSKSLSMTQPTFFIFSVARRFEMAKLFSSWPMPTNCASTS